MGKRLSRSLGKLERAAIRATMQAREVNPSTQVDIGHVRISGQPRALWGSSNGLPKGIIHEALGRPVYAQHKRRKPTAKPQVYVAPVEITPETVRHKPGREVMPTPHATKRITRPNKVIPVVRKVRALDGYRPDAIDLRLSVKSFVR